MKGTLFSADFVKDSNNNLRLLEFNTDTGITGEEVGNFNFNEFIEVLENNNISELAIIYKPFIHNEIVNAISESIHTNSPTITSISLYDEDVNTIYPTSVDGSDTKFVLRLAYDESAIFDSTYCKGKLELLNLFSSNNSGSYTVGYYYSSSDEFNNTLDYVINPTNLPDVAVKDIIESHNPIDFYKIGNPSNETDTQRWDSFVDVVKSENKIIQQYHYGPSSVDENNHLTSIRSFHIVYGGNLDIITLHAYEGSSIFDLPSDISGEVDNTKYDNKLEDHHYYEYTTNYIKVGSSGLLSTHEIKMSDNSYSVLSDINIGDSISSYYISGSPTLESDNDLINWSYEGNSFPSGSFITSSEVVFKQEADLKYGGLVEIVVDSDSKFAGPGKQWLIYESSSNQTKYKYSTFIDPATDYFYDVDGNLIDIDEANFYITSDANINLVELDVEDTDTYIVSGSTSFNSIISHNAPCFVAGTKITLSDGSLKNIEDVIPGEVVATYDIQNNEIKYNVVNAVFSKKVNKLVEYNFDNGEVIKCTLDHPLYVEGKGWSSYNVELSEKLYSLESKINQINIGDSVKLFKGTAQITNIVEHDGDSLVYNLQDIEGNHNFFANNILVHNRYCFVAGTKITLSNGDVKDIENVVVGDVVLSYNEKTNTQEFNKVTNIYTPKHDDLVEYTFSDGTSIISTFDHPYYTNGLTLASYSPDLTLKRYETLDNVVGIKVGDLVNLESGETISIVSIKEMEKVLTQTYIFSVENTHNFYANNILVHNKL